ncbi:MAG: rod shape-determining protein [Candidatus Eremiobacteraeota bacterium]|nr:rod shape-determining protein [Candidatus Eremiobacteraeota bacterium]
MNNITMDTIMSRFSADVGIDLGTATTCVVARGTGVKLCEPSYVAYDIKKKKIIAIGRDAKVMFGRHHGNIQIIRPIKDGVIGNFEMASLFIEFLMRRIKNYGFLRPRVMLGVPADISEVERRAVQEAIRIAGARTVYLVEQPIAAAIGADVPIMESYGCVVLDLGAASSKVSVISLGGIVMSRSTPFASEKMDEAIQTMVRKKFNLLIGDNTSEDLKVNIGAALQLDEPIKVTVKGRDLTSGLPRAIYINSDDINECLIESIRSIVDLVKNCIEFTPPELMGDIIDKGVVMTGGGAMLQGLDVLLTHALKLKCRVPPEPAFCVARGIERIFKDQRLMNAIFKQKKGKISRQG